MTSGKSTIRMPVQADMQGPDLTPSFLGRCKARINRMWKSESGTATLEFVICIPVIMAIFMASIESGVLMVRHVMLEQSLDMTMRDLRLGNFVNPTTTTIKDEICKRSVILHDCETNIRIELQSVNTATWAMPAETPGCVDRGAAIQPATTFNPGAQHEVMLVRVCVTMDALFPAKGIGLSLPKDAGGGYGLIATSVFVNEP